MTPDPSLSPDQVNRIDLLSSIDRELIDSQLQENCTDSWRKVARIVGETMLNRPVEFQNIPDVYFAERIYEMVTSGDLEFQGKIGYMRDCEVRKAAK